MNQDKIKLDESYEASEDDEKAFFLIYHMSVSPSEAGLDLSKPAVRDWLIMRFMMQKQAEERMMQEQMKTQEIMRGLGNSSSGLQF